MVNKEILLVVITGKDIFRVHKNHHRRTFMPFMYATVVYM